MKAWLLRRPFYPQVLGRVIHTGHEGQGRARARRTGPAETFTESLTDGPSVENWVSSVALWPSLGSAIKAIMPVLNPSFLGCTY